MKDLSIEQKAKRYDEALDNAKVVYKAIRKDLKPVIEQIFPELQENEDERIRKAIINIFATHKDYEKFFGVSVEDIIAWLEKQGETNSQNNNPFKIESDKFYFCIKDYFAGGCYRSKKGDIVLAKNGMNMMGLSPKEASEYFMPINPFNEYFVALFEKLRGKSQEETVDNANKIRPKFDIGDWITCPAFIPAPHLLHVINIEDGLYEFEDIYGTKKQPIIGDIESIYYHWTIEDDAKDGDVLCLGDVIAIFKKYIGQEECICYCSFCDKGGFEIPIENGEDNVYGCTNTTPATKEQRDLLFARMKENGYRWDEDKKEVIRYERFVSRTEG